MTTRLTTPCPPPADLLDMCRAQVRANVLARAALVPVDAVGYEPGPYCTHCDPTDRGCTHCVVEYDYAIGVLVGMACPGLRGAACESGERLRNGAYVLPSGRHVCLACAVCACCDGEDDAEVERVERALEKEMTK